MTTHFSFVGKAVLYLVGITALLLILYFGRPLFVPMFYGLFIAIVLYPISKWLEDHRVPRSIAVALCITILVAFFLAIASVLLAEMNLLRKDLPLLLEKSRASIHTMETWITENTGITIVSQERWLNNSSIGAGSILQQTLSATVSAVVSFCLIPVFAAIFLYNRAHFVGFAILLTPAEYKMLIRSIFGQIVHTYHHFIKGMLLVYLIVGILNSLGLLILGVPHAIVFGLLTAIMTIIPYAGIVVSSLLPISISWVTSGSLVIPAAIILLFGFIQYLEANIIFPKIVGSQLNISTWATLVAIMAGGILWGMAGMILFIPFAGMLKLFADAFPGMHPLGFLLSRK